MKELWVSSYSAPNKVAGAIAGIVSDFEDVELQAIGAGAVNQAIKSIAIARGYVAPLGIDLVCVPAFANVLVNDETFTALKLIVQRR